MTQEPVAATAPPMGRKPIGGKGVETRMVPMRWSVDTLARIEAVAGKGNRSPFIRDAVKEALAVAEKLAREGGKDVDRG